MLIRIGLVENKKNGMSTVNKKHIQKYLFMFKKYKFLDTIILNNNKLC